jgi:DNA-binding NarL/FixJ family response regulator
MNRLRVLLGDDHPATVTALRAVLDPEFEIVAVVDDGAALIEAAERLVPDVIVTDIAMPRLSGIAAAGAILHRHPAARIVFATVHADRALMRRGLALGAFGYVLKVRAADEIVAAVRAAMRGDLHISAFPPLEDAVSGGQKATS